MKKTSYSKIIDLFQQKSIHNSKEKSHVYNSSQRDRSSHRSNHGRKTTYSISAKNKENSEGREILTDRSNFDHKVQDFQICLAQPRESRDSLLKRNSNTKPSFRINTSIRFRPFNLNEIKSENCKAIESLTIVNDKSLKVNENSLSFDKIFTPQCTDEDIYNQCGKELVANFINGYNATIFAYGQTGSGKTYTMFEENEGHKGIVPLAIKDLWQKVGKINKSDSPKIKVLDEEDESLLLSNDKSQGKAIKLSCSMLEIYKENVYDLLSEDQDSTTTQTLKIKESNNGFNVKGLNIVEVDEYESIMKIIQKGNQTKKIRETVLNQTSSRSHIIFTVYLKVQIGENQVKNSRLNLIDLAGSEKVSKSRVQGEGLQQAKKINLSLSVLGNTISALVRGQEHVPYRQSKLTKLLHESLGGNSLTSLIVTCSMHESCAEETLSSLKFANRAKNVKNHPSQNIVKLEDKSKYIDRFLYDSLKLQLKEKEDTISQINAYLDEDLEGSQSCCLAKIRNLMRVYNLKYEKTFASIDLNTNDPSFMNSTFNKTVNLDSYKISCFKESSCDSSQQRNNLSNKAFKPSNRNDLSVSRSKSKEKSYTKSHKRDLTNISKFEEKSKNQEVLELKEIMRRQQRKIYDLEKYIKILKNQEKVGKQNYKVTIKTCRVSNQKSKGLFETPENHEKERLNSESKEVETCVRQLYKEIEKLISSIEKDKKEYYNFEKQILVCQIDDLMKKLYTKEQENSEKLQSLRKRLEQDSFIGNYISFLESSILKSFNFIKQRMIHKECNSPVTYPFNRSPLNQYKNENQMEEFAKACHTKYQDMNKGLDALSLQNLFLKQKVQFFEKSKNN